MQFKKIRAGSFTMGSDSTLNLKLLMGSDSMFGSRHTRNEWPMHRVNISKDFQIGKYEITLGQFKKFLVEKKGFYHMPKPSKTEKEHQAYRSRFKKEKNEWDSAFFWKRNACGDSAPVVCVSYIDALNFIKWINAIKPAYDRGFYRLPTEAEWEYCCRAGSTALFCFGDDEKTLKDYALYNSNKTGFEWIKLPGKCLLVKRNLMHGVYMICMEMYGNYAVIGTEVIILKSDGIQIPVDLKVERIK